MKKKVLLFIMTVLFIFPNVTAYAAGDSGAAGSDDAAASNDAGIDASTYYYNQFNNDAYRNVYDQLAEAAASFHSSDQNAEYEQAGDSSYYKAFSINVTSKNWEVISASGMQSVIYAFLADHPTYFWMSSSFQYNAKSVEGGAVIYEVQIICFNEYANGSSRQVVKNNADITISNYVGSLDPSLPDYQKEYLLHNAIIEDVYLNTEAETTHSGSPWYFSIDGIFNSKYKSASSFGYAKAFKAVMDEAGVPCIYVEGNKAQVDAEDKNSETYNSHAWNMVYLDDGWYIVDLAKDDPETTSGKNVLVYDYFNITSEAATDLEPATDWLSGIPTCTGTSHSISSIQSSLEKDNIWQEDNYNFIDKILDTYGISVVLISVGIILLLIIWLFKRIHKRSKKRRVEKIKNTKTVAIDHSELDNELRKPPL